MEKESYRVFKTLGNSKRLRIVEILFKQNGLSVEDISRKIDTPYKNTSKHLLILQNLGLIERKQNKYWGLYSLHKTKKDYLNKILSMAKELL